MGALRPPIVSEKESFITAHRPQMITIIKGRYKQERPAHSKVSTMLHGYVLRRHLLTQPDLICPVRSLGQPDKEPVYRDKSESLTLMEMKIST